MPLAVSLACGGSERVDPETLRRGRQIYGEEGCAACHGSDLRGAQMAPSLKGMGRHWDAESLERFLRDPDAVIATSKRLENLDARYPANMPGVFIKDSERLRVLVAFLMAQ